MQRYRSYGGLDESPGIEGDVFFVGVNERLNPAQLPPGYVQRAKNMRFRNGRAEPRLGIQVLPCGKVNGITPFTDPVEATVFFDITDKLDWIVIVAEGKVWKTRPNNVAVEVGMPAGETVANFAQFIQAKGVLIMLRGEGEAPLYCRDLDLGFEHIPDPAGSALPIPNSRFGLFISNRTVLVKDLYNIAVSQIGSYTSYEQVTSTFQINEGDFDTLVAVIGYQEGTLIAGKDNSIWGVQGFYGDLSQAVGPLKITDQYGLGADRSFVRYGRDLAWWATQGGVATLKLTEQNEIQSREVFLSDEMPETLRRVNQSYTHKIRSIEHNGELKFFLPLDEAKIYGDQLIPAGQSYTTGSSSTDPITGITVRYHEMNVTAGATYRWAQSDSQNDIYLQNGSEKYYGGVEFVAAGATVQFYGRFNADVTATLEEVEAEGVLNGVLIYDLNNQAWAGTDESEALQVVAPFKCVIDGKEELCFLGQDGFIYWYGVGYHDEVMREVETPYAEVAIVAGPALAQTIQVNGGTLVTAAGSQSLGGNWLVTGATSSDITRFTTTIPSYAPDPAASNWTSPNCTRTVLGINPDGGNPDLGAGIRFVSTNGVLPEVKINGVAVTEDGFYGANEWAYVELRSGEELTQIPIETLLITRGYRCQEPDNKRFKAIKAHISTWGPKFSVSTIVDGVDEETDILEQQQLSRTRYDQKKADWDGWNGNGDFLTAHRGDYSVLLPASGLLVDPAGVQLELHQDYELNRRVSDRGAYMQLKFTNTEGRLEIRQVSMEANAGDRTFGLKQ